ncbi:MAG: TonB family protein [Desulfobacterales bacterium]|nr:TonB family protein [Desulfobacterales bacterium]
MRVVDYGALELKQSYQRNMAISIAMAGFLVLFLMSAFFIYNCAATPPYRTGIAIIVAAIDILILLGASGLLVFRSVIPHPYRKKVAKRIATIVSIIGLLIIILAGGLVIFKIVSYQSLAAVPVMRINSIADMGIPPSISKTKMPTLAVAAPNVAPPKVGVPKAVPDEKAPQEQEFATQADLKAIQSLSATDLLGSGGGDSLAIDIPSDEYLPSPDEFRPYDEPPKFVKKVEPKYPRLARMSGVTGKVFVQVLVDKSGKVRDVKIYKDSGTNAGLEEAAIEAAKASEFTPAISNNQPIAVWAIYYYDFTLKSK